MPSNAFARPAFGPALAVTVFSSLAPPLFAADTQLQTVTVQASSQADDDALPTRPPTSVYGGTETQVLDTPRSITQVTVSYTHLTLPTILLV